MTEFEPSKGVALLCFAALLELVDELEEDLFIEGFSVVELLLEGACCLPPLLELDEDRRISAGWPGVAKVRGEPWERGEAALLGTLVERA